MPKSHAASRIAYAELQSGLNGVSNCKTTDEMKVSVIRERGSQHGGELVT